jgi:hypothetical protein
MCLNFRPPDRSERSSSDATPSTKILTQPHYSPQISELHVFQLRAFLHNMAADGSLESESEFWLFGYG